MQDFANIFGKRQNLYNLLFLILLAVALPIALYLVSQQQSYRSQAGGGQAINIVSDNAYDQNGKTYIKPIAITDPSNPDSTQYRYQVTISLNPPEVSNQSVMVPGVSPAYAQATQCTYSAACNIPTGVDTKINGTTFCRYRDSNACAEPTPKDCFVSVNSTVPGCGLSRETDALVDVSCKAVSSTTGIGQPVTFKITYNSNLAPFVKSATVSDSSGQPTSVEGAGSPISGKYEVTLTRTYAAAFSGRPTATLLLNNNKGATLPVSCDQVSVGASSIKADLSGDESLLSGQAGQYSISVSNPNTDPSLGVAKIDIYAAHADGSALVAKECASGTLVNGACRVYTNSNFQALQKEFSKSGIKWTPTLPATSETDYYLYAEVTVSGQTPASCSGARGAARFTPCSGQSNLDVTVGIKPGYIGYAVAASISELSETPVKASNITSWPQEVTFPPANATLSSWQTPGPRTIYAKFISNTGQELVVNRSVELVSPDPEIRAVSCNIGADGKNLSVTVRGNYFGSRNDGKLTVNGTTFNVTQWKTNQASSGGSDLIVGSFNTTATTNQEYTLELSRADGAKSTAKCSVGVSTLNLGAKVICRGPSNAEVSNVELTIADGFDVQNGTKGKVTKTKVTIGADGVVKGLNAILQTCNYYKLGIKAPNSLRRDVEFQAADGSTVIPDFKLPVGDIFPTGGDGKINSFDVAELIRQWSASPGTVRAQSTATDSATTQQPTTTTSTAGRTADFNQDGVVNSFDFSCLVSNYNQESDPEVKPGPVNVAQVGDFCQREPDASPQPVGGIDTATSTPTPTPEPSPTSATSSPAVIASTIPVLPSPLPVITPAPPEVPLPSNLLPPSPLPVITPTPSEPSATLRSVTFQYYPNRQTELNAANNFSGQIDLDQSIDPTTGTAILSGFVTYSDGNIIASRQAVKFIVNNYVRQNFSRELSAYGLFTTCLPDSSILARWTKQADKRYRVVMYDCTDENPVGSCYPGVIVGSTEFTPLDLSQSGTLIAESLASGRPMRFGNSDGRGDYPGDPTYALYRSQLNRRYSVQLFEQNLDGSGTIPVDKVATPEFKCSTAKNTFSPTVTYSNPNTYGLEVACQKDGNEIDALWWTFGKNGALFDVSKYYKAVAYDCTYDTTPDCSDGTKNFIAGETQYNSSNNILNGQKFITNGQTLITQPGHRYEVQLFSRDASTGAVSIPDNASVKTISCR